MSINYKNQQKSDSACTANNCSTSRQRYDNTDHLIQTRHKWRHNRCYNHSHLHHHRRFHNHYHHHNHHQPDSLLDCLKRTKTTKKCTSFLFVAGLHLCICLRGRRYSYYHHQQQRCLLAATVHSTCAGKASKQVGSWQQQQLLMAPVARQ